VLDEVGISVGTVIKTWGILMGRNVVCMGIKTGPEEGGCKHMKLLQAAQGRSNC
jgi:hypothetical protein